MTKEVVQFSVTREAIDDASLKEKDMGIIFWSHFVDLMKQVRYKNWETVDITLSIETKEVKPNEQL